MSALAGAPNQPVRRHLDKAVPPFAREQADQWLSSLIDHPYAWAIESPTLWRSARLDRVNFADWSASFATGLLPSHNLGEGLGTEADRTILHYTLAS